LATLASAAAARPPAAAERQNGIVLKRPFQRGDGGDGVDGVLGAVAPKGVDHRAAEKVETARHLRQQRALYLRTVAQRGQRADKRGAHEFSLLGLQARQQRWRQRGVGVGLEPFVGGFAHAIVAVGEQAAHQCRRAAVVERRQHDQRPVSHELVGVFRHGLRQCGPCLRGRRSADHPRRVHARRKVERGQVGDVGLEVAGRRRGLRCGGAHHRRATEHGRHGEAREPRARAQHIN
jgi:hypothetical protein